jgi:muramoyltetrapeptide carboxypeptidase
MGYGVVLGETATAVGGLPHTSGSPAERAADLNAMFRTDSIAAVVATIGGNASNQILDHLDLDLVASRPKLLIGFSDVTLLQGALWQSTGLGCVAGPALLPQFGEYGGLHPFTARAFLRLVGRPAAAGVLPASPSMVCEIDQWDVDDDRPRAEAPVEGPRALRDGAAAGHLIPVNTESLAALLGTRWLPDVEGAILVLEAAETSSLSRFHQVLTQFRQAGLLDAAAAVVLGRFDPRSGATAHAVDAIVEETVPPGIPVAADLDFGHTNPLLSLPWGVRSTLRVRAGSVELALVEPAVGDS